MWKFDDDKTAAVITAREHVACGHNRQDSCPALVLPETAILFYMHSGPQYLQEHYPCTLLTEKLPRFLQGGPVWKLDEKICFLDGGRGAPQAVDTIETLAVLGVKRVVTVGMCGGFSEQVAVGDILVPDKAFVEEGTSLHYYEQIDFARPDEQLFEQLQNIPEAKVLPIVTTDAVYRQTFYKEQLWREKGAVAVDMETSALWSVGKFLGLQVASVLMISDRHPLREGEPAWEWKMTMEMRRRLFERVMEIVFSKKKKKRRHHFKVDAFVFLRIGFGRRRGNFIPDSGKCLLVVEGNFFQPVVLGEAVKIEVGKFPGAKFIELFLVYLDNVAVPDQRVVRGVPGVCLPEQQGSGQQAKQQDKAEQRLAAGGGEEGADHLEVPSFCWDWGE